MKMSLVYLTTTCLMLLMLLERGSCGFNYGQCFDTSYQCEADCIDGDSCYSTDEPYCCSDFGGICYDDYSECYSDCIGNCNTNYNTQYCCYDTSGLQGWAIAVTVVVILLFVAFCIGFWSCLCCPFCMLAKSRANRTQVTTAYTIPTGQVQMGPPVQQGYVVQQQGYPAPPPNYSYSAPQQGQQQPKF